MTYLIRACSTRRYTMRVLLTALLALALVAGCLALAPREVQAAADSSADDHVYYAQVKYYDHIQMRYVVQHGIDEYWTTTGDIPIGGFIDGSGTRLLDQAYCVDATVAFHSSAETKTTYPSGVTTDTTNAGYVVASPLAVSPNVRTNLPSLYWLAVNGFRGERGATNNLASIRAAYADLETRFGTPIDDTIAIMATKAAVWNFTDPTFALLSTSLVANPAKPTETEKARYQLMVALMSRLVTDARVNGLSLATTTLNVTFNNGSASFTQPLGSGSNWYYGPITVQVSASNGTGTPENVFLTASGMYASEFVFMNNNNPTAVPLPKAAIYGSDQQAPFVGAGDQFYIMVPDDVARAGACVNVGQPNMQFAYLAVHGLGRSANVTYSDTPAIMAWQGSAASSDGTQKWDHVQAFIGFVNNIEASLYGEGNLFFRGNNDDGILSISKAVTASTDTPNAGSFVFKLEVFDNNLQDWVAVPLLPEPLANYNITGNAGLSGPSPGGTFSLADGAQGGGVKILHLPFGRYRILEQPGSSSTYTTTYQLDTLPVTAGDTVEAVLGPQTPGHSLVFTNTIVPKRMSGRIDIQKTVFDAGASATEAGPFAFTVEAYDETSQAWAPVPLIPAPLDNFNISGSSGLVSVSSNGTFTLAGSDAVSIIGLSFGQYRVSEHVARGTYTTTWQVDADASTAGTTAVTTLDAGAETRLVSFTNTLIPTTITGSIDARKAVVAAAETSVQDAGRFTFTLEMYDSNLGQWVAEPLVPEPLAGANISGSSGLDHASPSGTFSLADADQVHIFGLPLGSYRLSEHTDSAVYTTTYQLDAAGAQKDVVVETMLDANDTDHSVVFTNTHVSVPGSPQSPNKPNGTLPATGGDAGLLIWFATLLAGAGLLYVTAGIFGRRTR
ncbi:MAG: thioester domain-containing protein [Coriobacteriales bacterium]|nr:thioester domain-containing protein [Coriobacteriales bacterium]